ncbi:nucleoside hydrolase [Dolichospermum lemmermannii CS-548]|nr:nucleoside hydrolase [Dolichospermum lemmermannii]MDB9439561.1 nucleoside hydrolase [Dolichospermum lemmermannii CS-548]
MCYKTLRRAKFCANLVFTPTAALTSTEIDMIAAFGTEKSLLAVNSNRVAIEASIKIQGAMGLTLADPVAMAVALDPAIVTRQGKYFVDVETTSDLTRGMTVVDQLGVLDKQPNITVVWEIDIPRWKEILYSCLKA